MMRNTIAVLSLFAVAACAIPAGAESSPRPKAFKDCLACPEMLALPAGSFRMGASRETDQEAKPYEGPMRTVTVPAFAIGRFEVTFVEWDACVAAGGCAYEPDDRGWGRGRRPVINVAWTDIGPYLAWLSKETGQSYRLPSEAEWEYAARAGTTTRYWWGDRLQPESGKPFANCLACAGLDSGSRTAPVGSFPANPFGLHDTQGNAWEWVADCWHRGYAGAPADARVRPADGPCRLGILRGGAWLSPARNLRVSHREGYDPTFRYASNGFRVARDLP